MVDVAKETAAVSEACSVANLGGHALWVQLGGRMHQARVQALKAKCCVVDGGDGTHKLDQAIEEALEAANPEEVLARTMAQLKGTEGPLWCDKDVGKLLNKTKEELDQAAEIVAQAVKHETLGMEDDFSKRVAGSASARGVESGRRELQEMSATVSAKFTAGLGAVMRLTSSKLLPDFERVCAGAAPEQEAMAKLGTEPTVQLLPALTPKFKNFMDVAAQCGAATDDAAKVHKRLRVYLGVAHVVDMLYGKDKQAQAPAPDNCAATVRKLKSLGIWEDMPVALQEELTKDSPKP